MNNGPGYEPRSVDLPDGVVYCVDCGTIFVWGEHRDCPTCHVNDRLDELEGDDGRS